MLTKNKKKYIALGIGLVITAFLFQAAPALAQSFCMSYAGGVGSLVSNHPTSSNCDNQCPLPNVCRQGTPSGISQSAKAVQERVTGAAANLINLTTSGLGWIIAKIGYLIGYVLGILVAWEAKAIAWAIDPRTFQYTKAPAVELGWEITRNFVNLGFVIALIVIAMATILRLESYGMRRTLWRLIAAAIYRCR